MLTIIKFISCFIFLVCIARGAFSSNLDSFTEKEKSAIDELRKRLKNELYEDYMQSDGFLIPWIRDRSFNLDAAQEKILKCIKWRKDNNIDNILNDPEYIKFSSKLPTKVIGRDEFGSAITEWKLGSKYKIRKNILAGNSKQQNLHFHYLFESIAADLWNVRKESGLNVSQTYLIVDLNGYNLREHGCLACIPWYLAGIATYENYYVGILKYILVPNAPKVFESLGKIIQSNISPTTKEAFKVFSVADNPEVKRLIASTNPKFISREWSS